jgi:hypothetical protein
MTKAAMLRSLLRREPLESADQRRVSLGIAEPTGLA